MAVVDDVQRLTSIVTRLMVADGVPTRLRQRAKIDASALGKACGVSASVITGWESGLAEPSTAQSLAWLSTLYDAQPSSWRQASRVIARERAGET